MFGIEIVKSSELPFYREVNRLIKKYPEYQEGIQKGLVHIKFRPGCAPKKSKTETYQTEVEVGA